MSSDNGWVMRKNKDGKIVLQEYFASSEFLPSAEEELNNVFESIEAAVQWYNKNGGHSEYGLSVAL